VRAPKASSDRKTARAAKPAGRVLPQRGPVQTPAEAETRVRRILLSGAVLLAAGLGVVGTRASEAGMVITLMGLVLCVYAVHTLGRLGPDTG